MLAWEVTDPGPIDCGPPALLHVSPHPDDEVLGCGATLTALAGAGWRVVNLVCSLGRPTDRARRRAELEAAATVLGFETVVADPLVPIGAHDDRDAAEARIGAEVGRLLESTGAAVVVSPQPADGHHGHQMVGRAVARAGVTRPGLRWWAWGLWADLAAPNLYFPYGPDRLDHVARALDAYAGELARNGYADLLPARGRVAAVLGAERVFGFGRPAVSALPYADLLVEATARNGRWEPSPPRLLDPTNPL